MEPVFSHDFKHNDSALDFRGMKQFFATMLKILQKLRV